MNANEREAARPPENWPQGVCGQKQTQSKIKINEQEQETEAPLAPDS